ncbi:MAG: hypothetical protein QM809_02320 [Gordonia sp. (in: high G+C Gram-positive bacteria)]|uniref:hypothetical protein n=1 Tax=Gordonia sp. (in: high G+C Gram-positive bacteria) TaxID=84139 RepID=UPI0039E56775
MEDRPWYAGPTGWLVDLGTSLPIPSSLPSLPIPSGLRRLPADLAVPVFDTARRIGALPIEPLFAVLRAGLVGRRIETSLAGERLAFTVTGIDARFDPVSAAIGQADDVSFSGGDVEYDDLRATSVTVRPRHVHTRLAFDPLLVAAPVDIVVVAEWDQVQVLLRRHLGGIDIESLGGTRVRLRTHGTKARHGWVDVELAVAGGRLELRPTAAGWGDWLPQRRFKGDRAIPISTALSENVRITEVSASDDEVTVVLRLDEWSMAYSRLLSF